MPICNPWCWVILNYITTGGFVRAYLLVNLPSPWSIWDGVKLKILGEFLVAWQALSECAAWCLWCVEEKMRRPSRWSNDRCRNAYDLFLWVRASERRWRLEGDFGSSLCSHRVSKRGLAKSSLKSQLAQLGDPQGAPPEGPRFNDGEPPFFQGAVWNGPSAKLLSAFAILKWFMIYIYIYMYTYILVCIYIYMFKIVWWSTSFTF